MIFSSFNVPQVLVFSLFPAFLQLVVPTRKLKLGWKFSVSEKMITYAVMGITFNFNQDSAVAGIIIGVLMMQWKEEIIPIGIEETEVKGLRWINYPKWPPNLVFRSNRSNN